MSTRYFVTPAPVEIIDPRTKKRAVRVEIDQEKRLCDKCRMQVPGGIKEVPEDLWSLYRLCVEHVFIREEWLSPLSRQRMADRILNKLEDLSEGDIGELSEEHWRALKETMEKDDFALPKGWGYQLVGLCDVLLDASETRPEPKVVEDEAAS